MARVTLLPSVLVTWIPGPVAGVAPDVRIVAVSTADVSRAPAAEARLSFGRSRPQAPKSVAEASNSVVRVVIFSMAMVLDVSRVTESQSPCRTLPPEVDHAGPFICGRDRCRPDTGGAVERADRCTSS